MAVTNTQKRTNERQLLGGVNLKVRQQVLKDKSASFYNDYGEDLSEKYELTVKTTDSQARALQRRDLMESHVIDNGKFIITFFESAKLLGSRFPSLLTQDIARLIFIGTYVAWETNRLQSDNGKKVLKKKDIRELIVMSPKRFNELYKKYVAAGVVIEGDDKELYINPTVLYRGNVKELGGIVSGLDHTRVFRKTVRELYAQFNGRKISQLALVYSVIPFLNFDSNMICHNPNEIVTDKVKPINIKELADILGYENDSKLKKSLNGINVDGVPMFTFIEGAYNRRNKRIIVNPRIIFAGNGEALEQIKKYFN